MQKSRRKHLFEAFYELLRRVIAASWAYSLVDSPEKYESVLLRYTDPHDGSSENGRRGRRNEKHAVWLHADASGDRCCRLLLRP